MQYWCLKIENWASQKEIDPNLVATVMQIESCGNPKAKSGAGAIGLFQVMPYHFEINEDPYKPKNNADKGVSYLESALNARNGDVRLALAGYNGGINGTKQPESAWAKETRQYAYWGIGIYQDAEAGLSSSNTLDEWLNAGGHSLCQQAANRQNQ